MSSFVSVEASQACGVMLLLGPGHRDDAREKIGLEGFFGVGGKPVHALAEVRGLGRDENANAGWRNDHEAAFSARHKAKRFAIDRTPQPHNERASHDLELREGCRPAPRGV